MRAKYSMTPDLRTIHHTKNHEVHTRIIQLDIPIDEKTPTEFSQSTAKLRCL